MEITFNEYCSEVCQLWGDGPNQRVARIKFCERDGCSEVTANDKYCSRRCAAIVNNTLAPKRKKTRITLTCTMCGFERFAYVQNDEWLCTACRCTPEAFVEILKTRKAPPDKETLFRIGLKYRFCEECGVGEEWNGSPLMLQLEHVDGDRTHNRIENLKILCPNCHSQTPTYAGRNIGRPFATLLGSQVGKAPHSDSEV